MSLRILRHNVKNVSFGQKSSYGNENLFVNAQELKEICLKGMNDYELDFHVAVPGEKTRIVHITDTVKPAFKENSSSFPGWIPGENKAGEGITHQLEGMTVMQCCLSEGIQEGIVDMWGKGAKYSQFSSKINLVMDVRIITDGMPRKKLADELVIMILRASDYLASLAAGSIPCKEDLFSIETGSGLPRIGYAYYIQAQGLLRNVYINGESCVEMNPMFLDPCKIMDGLMLSGNYIIACQKNPTYFHQENPVILDLFERNGKSLNFSGVIVSTESNLFDVKKSNARQIADIAYEKGFDGIIITQEGGGHADVDLMMALDACHERGIKAVIQTNEIAGPKGDLPPLVCYSNNADAIVTNGNNDEIIELDGSERVIGGKTILNGSINPYETFSTNLGILYTSTNQLGSNFMTSIEY